MRYSFLIRQTQATVFALAVALSPAMLGAQAADRDEADDPALAHARAGRTWNVLETNGSDRWEATWTLRADGKTFDGHWKHYPGGNEGDLSGFARIVSIRGSNITVERPGVGNYTGTISADRRSIRGRNSWNSGGWQVTLSEPLPAAGSSAQQGSGLRSTSTYGTTQQPTGTFRDGAVWQVVETSGGDRWDAEWVVRADRRSFDASWRHSPGNDTGRLVDFAHITSLSGDQIVIARPGLGDYTGTISADRRSIRGAMSWARGGIWQVTLSEPLPASLAASQPGPGGPTNGNLRGGAVWQVIETHDSDRWDATWVLRSDGRTFDAHWTHSPGGNEGDLNGFARIVAIRGSSITVERSGLGSYTGTISGDRRSIGGRNSWNAGGWQVTLSEPLPASLP